MCIYKHIKYFLIMTVNKSLLHISTLYFIFLYYQECVKLSLVRSRYEWRSFNQLLPYTDNIYSRLQPTSNTLSNTVQVCSMLDHVRRVDGWAHYICITEPPTVYFSVCGWNIKRRIYLTQYFIVLKIDLVVFHFMLLQFVHTQPYLCMHVCG